MAKLALALACLLPAAGAAGCGGGGSGTATPTASVKTYLAAVGDGNGDAACSTLAPAFQRSTLQSARTQGINAKSCPDLFRRVSAQLDSATRDKFKHAKVSGAAVSGSTATVTVAGASDRPRLVKTGSEWLITGGIGF